MLAILVVDQKENRHICLYEVYSQKRKPHLIGNLVDECLITNCDWAMKGKCGEWVLGVG